MGLCRLKKQLDNLGQTPAPPPNIKVFVLAPSVPQPEVAAVWKILCFMAAVLVIWHPVLETGYWARWILGLSQNICPFLLSAFPSIVLNHSCSVMEQSMKLCVETPGADAVGSIR